jgi:hypothetical protein
MGWKDKGGEGDAEREREKGRNRYRDWRECMGDGRKSMREQEKGISCVTERERKKGIKE